ncbi:hypothetical protein JOD45_002170 [Scopulibacillus daqui]|uniref:Uncharacterized protein n=1 Tax=Scopulibacillus daqui TaxID=1469162 RepID=A0ABS2Q266_9BACL|nr:hypothetical protein [Scopulibacillus daqui]MBM7645945.1 hypothetical protein [Scopulibacillus daqui]
MGKHQSDFVMILVVVLSLFIQNAFKSVFHYNFFVSLLITVAIAVMLFFIFRFARRLDSKTDPGK